MYKRQNHDYSFDWGDVHFTVLDTSLVEEKQWVPDLFEKEKAWAEKDITCLLYTSHASFHSIPPDVNI